MTRSLLIAGCLVGLLASPAAAEPKAYRDHQLGIAVSPLKLLMPVGEVQVEAYLGESYSATAIVGFGQTTVEDADPFTTIVGGLQLRGYFHGSNEEGGYAVFETRYTSLDGEPGTGWGLTIGPGLGYKWTWANLFLDFNGGLGWSYGSAESTRDGITATATEQDAVPILNFTVGWGL